MRASEVDVIHFQTLRWAGKFAFVFDMLAWLPPLRGPESKKEVISSARYFGNEIPFISARFIGQNLICSPTLRRHLQTSTTCTFGVKSNYQPTKLEKSSIAKEVTFLSG